MRVDQDVLRVLQDSIACEGSAARITGGELSRELYLRVNKVLEFAGGKWNRSAKAHLFSESAADALEQVILTGEILDSKQELGAFFTPDALARTLVTCALDLLPRPPAACGEPIKALEPSAGEGAIVRAMLASGISDIVACEINSEFSKRRPLLRPSVRWVNDNFLSLIPGATLRDDFDIVVMNPPFAKRADILHITHAAKCVRPGGRLISVASAAVLTRADRQGVAFRGLVERHGGSIEPLPAGSFKESGTMVNSVMVTMSF